MPGVYGGLIIILIYGTIEMAPVEENVLLQTDNTPIQLTNLEFIELT